MGFFEFQREDYLNNVFSKCIQTSFQQIRIKKQNKKYSIPETLDRKLDDNFTYIVIVHITCTNVFYKHTLPVFSIGKNVIDRTYKNSYFPFNTNNTSGSSPGHTGYMNINDNSQQSRRHEERIETYQKSRKYQNDSTISRN